MDHLLGCAEAFEQLLDVQYHIVLGRKNRLTELTLRFDPTEFHHLVGLHKLRDLRLARGNREKIFYQILSKTICMEDIKKSRYFPSRFGLQRYVIFFNPPNLFSRTFAFSFFAPSSENRIKLLFEQLFFSNADAKVGIILESANVLMIFISKNVIFLHLHPDTYL